MPKNTEQLPKDFEVKEKISLKNIKEGIWIYLSSFVLLIVLVILFVVFGHIVSETKQEFVFYGYSESTASLFRTIILFVSSLSMLIILTPIHEIIHGFFYKLFTKGKLKFGYNFLSAYCGVPTYFCNKITVLISSISPFLLLSGPLLLLCLINIATHIRLFFAVLFILHTTGCVGDLYLFFLLITKYSKKTVLVNDNGLEQTIYVSKSI